MTQAIISTQREEERVFLIGVQSGRPPPPEAEASLEELHRLAASTTGTIVGSRLVRVRAVDPGTFLSEAEDMNCGLHQSSGDFVYSVWS